MDNMNIRKINGFTVQLVADGVYAIDEFGIALMYLIIGKTQALLLDTGVGAGNVHAVVKELTDLPCLVVNSHHHYDHAGGNVWFDEVYAHKNAVSVLKEQNCQEVRRAFIERQLSREEYNGEASVADTISYLHEYRVNPIPFHLEAYGVTTVNYNRDVEIFPVLSAIFEEIMGECPYKSPTDMGVNMAGNCIIDDEACKEASRQEIIRRYYNCLCDLKRGNSTPAVLYKLELLMKQAGITVADRKVIAAAMNREEATGAPAAAIELPDGTLVTGKTSDLLGASAACLLNALKILAGIDHEIHLVSPDAIHPIQTLKINYLGSQNPRLHTDEILIALSISAATSPDAARALNAVPLLKGCEVHSSVLLSSVDEGIFKKLGMHLTCEPKNEEKDVKKQ